ncbi:nitroreductase family protein [Paenibacillus albidus]|uniref:nitroreductase family protein n=1 Tax=Paenibacillus albidus TaxID=2041023 RepID=UPI0028890FE6|nr:nitroreductase [Paenibacillus albidus]
MISLSLAELIRERRSIRKFNSTPVAEELVVELLQTAVQLLPSSAGVPWRSVYAGTPESRKRLADYMLQTVSHSRLGKLMPDKMLEVFKKRFMDIPAHVVVLAGTGPDPLASERNYAAVCSILQNFQLLGWERGLGMLWDTEAMIQNEGLFQGIGMRADERFVGILHVGYYNKAPRGRKRTPAEKKWTVFQG